LIGIAGTGALLALHWVLFFSSVQDSGVAVATQTFATFPLIMVFLDSVTRGRMPATVEIGAGAVIVIAAVLLVGRGLPNTPIARQGAFAGLLSAACFAAFSVGSQRLGQSVNSIALSAFQNVAVATFLLFGLPFAAPAPHGADWLIIAVLGIVATALMHQLFFFGLRHLPAAVCGGFVALEPVYAIIFAALLFSEPIGPAVILSGVLIIGASLVLLSRSEKQGLRVP
jgi:drug/metabolite transporter (DMT)-like permease